MYRQYTISDVWNNTPHPNVRGGEQNEAYWDILRELREDHDLTQAQVAAVIGTTQQVYYRYEKGINELPLHHLQTLCAYYNVSADYILGLPKGLRWPR